MAFDCDEVENRPPISWAMVAVCWLLPSGTTNSDASVIISSPPIKTPGSTICRRGGRVSGSGSVRVRLFDAGMMMGILTFVCAGGSGVVEVAMGNGMVVFGDESPPVSGEVTRGSGEKDIIHPRSTKNTLMCLHSLMYLKK